MTPAADKNQSSLTLTHKVSESLRHEIISGERVAGERLNEVAIANTFNVSRGPVREAILHLASEGLVVVAPHRGAFVKTLDPQGVMDLFELRIALESEAAALAAQRISGIDLARLRSTQQQSTQLVNANDDGFSNEVDLHDFIGKISMNTALAESVKSVNTELRLVRLRSGSSSSRAAEALREHDEIIKQISVRDAKGAREAMRYHLRRSLENTLEFMFSNVDHETKETE